jgi:hypothetical protein
MFFNHFTLYATKKIFFPHSTNDKGRENKNHYPNSDGGEPTTLNPISHGRTHDQSDNERDAQIHRHAWRSCDWVVMLRTSDDHTSKSPQNLRGGIASMQAHDFGARGLTSPQINRECAARMIQPLTQQRKDHAANIVDRILIEAPK